MKPFFYVTGLIALFMWSLTKGDDDQLISFSTVAEEKVQFEITVLKADLLSFSAYDAGVKGEFGVIRQISFEDAHHYPSLRGIFRDMCIHGGTKFRQVIFELDGFTCVGFLHEMFVAALVVSQHMDKVKYSALEPYTHKRARIVLFQNRFTEYQQVLAGVLDSRYAPMLATMKEEVDEESPQPEKLGVSAVIIAALSKTMLCESLESTTHLSPLSVFLSDGVKNALLHLESTLLYISYDKCINCGLGNEEVRMRLVSIVNEVLPSCKGNVIIEGFEFDQCHSESISQLMLYDHMASLAYDKGRFDYYFFVNDKRWQMNSNFPNIFSNIENSISDTLIKRLREPFDVVVELSSSCTVSWTAVAACVDISHIQIPRSLVAAFGGRLMPFSMFSELQRYISLFNGNEPTALAALSLYLKDLLVPFEDITLEIVVNTPLEEKHASFVLPTPTKDYIQGIVDSRKEILQNIMVCAKGSGRIDSSSCILLSSEYRERTIVTNPALVHYGMDGVHYRQFCKVYDCAKYPLSNIPSGENVLFPPALSTPNPKARIVFFTTILGEYETGCPSVVSQTIPTDFVCFTNSPSIIKAADTDRESHWIVDSYPYHLDEGIWREIEVLSGLQLHKNNSNQYDIVKFYKMNFFLFPRMKQYDYAIWIDGSVEIHSNAAARILSEKLNRGENLLIFEHSRKTLDYEARASAKDKRWIYDIDENKGEPMVLTQLELYKDMGYSELAWKDIAPYRPLYGMWVTCFIGYDMREPGTIEFLKSWYIHIQLFSSQCQMSFCYLSQMNQIRDSRGKIMRPHSLPDKDIHGTSRVNTIYRKKRYHGNATI